MHRMTGEDSAALRARWLGELADALEAARLLVGDLEAGDARVDAAALYARIEAVRSEVVAMRLKRSLGAVREFEPEWSESLPWTRSA
jgi:hypothetical protein